MSCFCTLIQSSEMLFVVLGVESLVGLGQVFFSNLTSVVFILLWFLILTQVCWDLHDLKSMDLHPLRREMRRSFFFFLFWRSKFRRLLIHFRLRRCVIMDLVWLERVVMTCFFFLGTWCNLNHYVLTDDSYAKLEALHIHLICFATLSSRYHVGSLDCIG